MKKKPDVQKAVVFSKQPVHIPCFLPMGLGQLLMLWTHHRSLPMRMRDTWHSFRCGPWGPSTSSPISRGGFYHMKHMHFFLSSAPSPVLRGKLIRKADYLILLLWLLWKRSSHHDEVCPLSELWPCVVFKVITYSGQNIEP